MADQPKQTRLPGNPQNLLDILLEPLYEADHKFQDKIKQLVEIHIKQRRKMLEETLSLAFGTYYVEMVKELVESHLEDPEKYISVASWPQETTIGVLTSRLVELHPTDDTKMRVKTKAAKVFRK